MKNVEDLKVNFKNMRNKNCRRWLELVFFSSRRPFLEKCYCFVPTVRIESALKVQIVFASPATLVPIYSTFRKKSATERIQNWKKSTTSWEEVPLGRTLTRQKNVVQSALILEHISCKFKHALLTNRWLRSTNAATRNVDTIGANKEFSVAY